MKFADYFYLSLAVITGLTFVADMHRGWHYCASVDAVGALTFSVYTGIRLATLAGIDSKSRPEVRLGLSDYGKQ